MPAPHVQNCEFGWLTREIVSHHRPETYLVVPNAPLAHVLAEQCIQAYPARDLEHTD